MPRVSSSLTPLSVADRFFKSTEVVGLTSLSRPTIWRLTKAKKFPGSYLLSPGRVGWLRSDICKWIADRTPRTEQRGSGVRNET